MNSTATIRIRNAQENNLKGISVNIPHHQLIVVTGVSGSGKSSLAFDVIAREGQRRFLETFSGFSRQYMGKLARPAVDSIEGLAPVITVGQKSTGAHARSTVGTMSDLYSLLRLLFARLGTSPKPVALNRSLFSFNSPAGACSTCNGLGLEEKISLGKLVANPELTLREGALAPTLPNGYIMYSQVTVDVLNTVCEAHGFNVDIPWNALTEAQQEVILNGSDRLKVPFGKHSLESRLKWTGITAKPREEGFYKGMLPIMSDILRRDRNKNILRYVESLPCSSCAGSRLNEAARSVTIKDQNIAALSALELRALASWLQKQQWTESEQAVATPIIKTICKSIELLSELGVGYLTLERAASTLSGGEAQRIRLVNQVTAELSNMLYVFDEPSIGLHLADNAAMLRLMRSLVQQGNTVLVVEHDEATIRHADWIVDIGPKAGAEGGTLLYNGAAKPFLDESNSKSISPTKSALLTTSTKPSHKDNTDLAVELIGCRFNNLKSIDTVFQVGAFNVITGRSGSGKSSLMHGVLEAAIKHQLNPEEAPPPLHRIQGADAFTKLITITQKPIGRTPRSNPATYTGLADRLRDLFASLPEAKAAGFKKGRFSFNNKGGRCETCQGAGRIQVGMHFLGTVDVVCGTCNGQRFNPETLTIAYKGKNISQVLELSVAEAIEFLADQPAILRYLSALNAVGLGYIALGQPSTTLSGGEAQRVKLASELHQKSTGRTLYLLDEPTIGLHMADVSVLIAALRALTNQGNTVVCVEHDLDLIRQADWLIDLGPGSGTDGGLLIAQGSPAVIAEHPTSATGLALRGAFTHTEQHNTTPAQPPTSIELRGVSTHRLQNINASIPRNALTVITGVSGSGKSSLAFDTLVAESQSRFSESLSTYVRSRLQQGNSAQLESSSGLGPVVALGRRHRASSGRSTVVTITGLYDHYRLLFSRIAQLNGHDVSMQHFSFNHQLGACPHCNGLGVVPTCNPAALIAQPTLSVPEGALLGHKPGNYYGDPHGQHVAILKEVAQQHALNIALPWSELDEATQQVILYGTGEREYDVTWEFKNKTREGVQQVRAPWLGFCNYVDEEYQRKLHNKNIQPLIDLLHDETCTACNGARLKPELLALTVAGKNIAEVTNLSLEAALAFFERAGAGLSTTERAVFDEGWPRIQALLKSLLSLRLGYLSGNRLSRTLSGGEAQRLRLAGQLSANLYGVTYVLDEPTVGLHPTDTEALMRLLRKLIERGNTVVVVEHDETVIRAADCILELGPGAGHLGGHIMHNGSLAELLKLSDSPTASMLRQPMQSNPEPHALTENAFGLKQANRNNLQAIDVDFTAGGLIAVTGVSGSGKSTLVQHVLLASASKKRPVGCEAAYGLERFDGIFNVDQQPVSTNALSTPATHTGMMDALRNAFAATEVAKSAKLGKSAFSYLHKDGRCASCNGYGQLRTSMDFMSDVWSPCETCNTLRYNDAVLSVKLARHSIGSMLQLSVAEAQELLTPISGKHIAAVVKQLDAMQAVGLGHVRLGQPGNTLSGGEAQRLKLAREMAKAGGSNNLYVFDEPTTGLHLQDIAVLLELFHALARQGHTVLYVEHHPALIAAANQVIELGPGSGPAGGKLIRH